MRRRAKVLVRVSAIAIGMAIFVGCGTDPTAFDLDAGEVRDLQAGDRVVASGIGAVVPPRGITVAAIADLEDGTSRELVIRHAPDGTIEVRREIEPVEVVGSAASAGACADGAYNLSPWKWRTRYRWSFRARSTPAGNNVAKVERALRRAAAGIVKSRNDCGMADTVSATHRYAGRTRAAPAIDSNGSCKSSDGRNVVGFGPLPSGTLGVACTWYDADRNAVESDVKLRRSTRWFATRQVPRRCHRRFGIEAVMVHEFGHTFGMGHVSESAHGALTMSTAIPPCSVAPSTLGRGDVLGLRAKY